MFLLNFFNWIIALSLAPFLFGVINRTKAFFAGRQGKPLLQGYYDIAKLLQKGAVYSRTTTMVFRLAPIVSLSALLTATFLVPFGGQSLVTFPGDFLVFIYLLGLTRFFMIIAALDTGSSFEGMGASREGFYAIFAELILLISLASLTRYTSSISLTYIFRGLSPAAWQTTGPVLALIVGALLIVFLTENARIPIDDPNTHLELTMIHEVLILDYCGVDLAYILCGVYLKFLILGSLLTNCLLPIKTGQGILDGIIFSGGMVLLAVVVGIIESVMARFRFLKISQFLVSAACLAILAFILQLR